MAFTVPEIEPERVAAGDRLQWTRKDLSDFPATSWTLTYYLRSDQPLGQIDIVATADGTNFSVDVSPTASAEYPAGKYYWTAFVSKSGDRKLVAHGQLEVLRNPTDVTTPVDGRSHARKVLDAINAVVENRATTDQQSYVFQAVGRSVTRMPIADLLKFRDYYAGLVRAEDEALAVSRGQGTGRNILVRFGL
jgi:hypothetical protein